VKELAKRRVERERIVDNLLNNTDNLSPQLDDANLSQRQQFVLDDTNLSPMANNMSLYISFKK